MNRIYPAVLNFLFYLSLGSTLDHAPNTDDAFNEGLRKVIEELKQIQDVPQLSSSYMKKHGNASLFPKFPCPRLQPSPSKPVSVHRLRPGDINVVAALGDSYTAARGAGSTALSSLLYDYRGLSFSVGGDGSFQTFQTLPNILREYNPEIQGFSNSIGDNLSLESGFNVAVSGATSPNLVYQVRLLIQKIQNNPLVDFQKDWKLVTILIGGNDLCRSCYSNYNSRLYLRHLKEALGLLKSSLPRTFVNLIEIMQVDLVRQLPRGFVCNRLQNYYCQCGAFPESEEDFKVLIKERKAFQRLTEELVSSGIYDDRDDFTVVLQPFSRNAAIPTIPGTQDIDYSVFAVDCFHLSIKGHSMLGLGLWNNMVQPVSNKTTDWSMTDRILCPSNSHPFLATSKNSLVLGKGENIKMYNLRHDDTTNKTLPAKAVERRRMVKSADSNTNTFDDSQKSDTDMDPNGKSMKEIGQLKQGLTIMVIATVVVLCLVTISGIAYYGIWLVKYYKKGMYQEIL